MPAGNSLSKEVAERSHQRRQASSLVDFILFIMLMIGPWAAVISVISLLPSLISPNYIATISVILGVAAIATTILLGFNWRRRNPRRFYRNESEIRDDNLRKLVSGIAKDQIEFEHRLTSAAKSSLPRS
jgi:hypothetical protein